MRLSENRDGRKLSGVKIVATVVYNNYCCPIFSIYADKTPVFILRLLRGIPPIISDSPSTEL